MKNIIYISILLLFTNIAYAQFNIINLDQYPNNGNLDGNYFKDNTNLLDNYIGVWQWTDGNKELTFYLYKDSEVPFNNPMRGDYAMDLIFGYYTYKENGVSLIDTKPKLIASLNQREWFDRGGIGMQPTSDGYNTGLTPDFYFTDYSRQACVNGENKPIKGDPGYWKFTNSTTASVGLYTGGLIYSNCEVQELFPNFPSNMTITLTRIASEAPPL